MDLVIMIERKDTIIKLLIDFAVVEPGKTGYKKLRQHFGNEYFDSVSGELLRKKFGDLVFSDENVNFLPFLCAYISQFSFIKIKTFQLS